MPVRLALARHLLRLWLAGRPSLVERRPTALLTFMLRAASTVILAGLNAPPALAWGADGHRLVADFAQARLSAPARAEADRLLALDPGATLASLATWADEVRNPATAPWHYVNLPSDGACRFDDDRVCLQGRCAPSAIDRLTADLRRPSDDNRRLHALKYLLHLVADLHQPLHAGWREDKGGNAFQLQAFGRGSNLHALWDSALISHWPGGLPALRTAMAQAAPPPAGLAPWQWAEESCRIVAATGFYPAGHVLPADYAAQWSGTMAQQLAAAGWRLAAVLESALVGAPAGAVAATHAAQP